MNVINSYLVGYFIIDFYFDDYFIEDFCRHFKVFIESNFKLANIGNLNNLKHFILDNFVGTIADNIMDIAVFDVV